MSTEAVATYLNIFLYALSYQLQRPVEPYLVRSLLIHRDEGVVVDGSSPSSPSYARHDESSANATYGRLTSFFSLIQTIGSPLIGALLDGIGPRRTSALVYASSAVSYSILSNASTPAMLYWSKVPTLLQHAFLVGQATVVGSRSVSTRASALGRMTTAYTIGATVGPALGGRLASSDYDGGGSDLYVGARVAVWLSLVSVGISLACLGDRRHGHCEWDDEEDEDDAGEEEEEEEEEDNDDDDDEDVGCRRGMDDRESSSSYSRTVTTTTTTTTTTIATTIATTAAAAAAARSNKSAYVPIAMSAFRSLHYLRHPIVGPLLFVKFLNGISSSAYTTILPLILISGLRVTTSQLGAFMSASSLAVAAFSAVGMIPAMRCVGNESDRLARAGIGCRLVSLILFGMTCSLVIMADRAESKSDVVDIAMAPSNFGLYVTTLASVAVSLSSHVHATALTTLVTGTVSPDERGTILGLEHGLFSLARIVGPPLGTTLLSWSTSTGAEGLWTVIAACVIMDVVLMACLNIWSSRSLSIDKSGWNKPLLEVGGDKDHSD
ncbi:hypothetical protein ACHAXA_002669 [Cyclostephanos tholiformis]|uniref:Major facilitator superfamily (MFS) profile domain-containing protein n=1 Tax=Cyclostephanos tholiformis TaxID=382380 RepID=A0ABD3S007_9STRA